jgi:hypothetical protein
MRLAMAISPSRDSSSTVPISRRYMRTGSSVRSTSVVVVVVVATSRLSDSSGFAAGSSSPSPSSSTTLTPISDNSDITSSICSDENWSEGRTRFNSS